MSLCQYYYPLQLAYAIILLNSASCSPTYTVIAPNVVRPNTDFVVAVSAHDIDAEQDVELRIRGLSDSGQTIEILQDTTVRSDNTQIVRLRIGDLGSGSYTLTARGRNPITFDQTQALTYVHKGYSVFIQTDKAIYRPGNTVKFRAIVVSPELKPSVVGSIDVFMSDGDGNVIKEWRRVFTQKGVFAGEIDIADAPVMGDWNITADVNGQVFSKSFLVAEYVLPKFEVDLDLPRHGTFSQGDVTVKISAKYHYGGPVKGEATVSLFPKYKSSYLQPIFSEPMRRVLAIDGSVDLKLNIAKELKLKDDYAREVVFDVQVKEEFTERIQNNTYSIVLHKYPYRMELVKTADAFKPGMPYTAYLNLASQDGSPVRDDLNQVSVKWGFSHDPETYNATVYDIPEDGIIELKFMPPATGLADVLGIEAQYKERIQWFSTIPRARSESENFLQARLKTLDPKVAENVRLSIETTEPIKWITYQIFGRGKLVFAETLRATRGNSNELNIRATSDMSPRCRVIVYYVRDTGEIVADALDFEVEGALTNKVELWASKSNPLPGEKITLNVKSEPNSFVGILAVDKSVKSLKTGHDLIESDVIDELRSYDSAVEPSFFSWIRHVKPQEGSLYWYTGASASRQVFEESGTVILSNGKLQNGRPSNSNTRVEHRGENRPLGRPLPSPNADNILNPDQGPGVEYESATRPPLAGPYAFSRLPRPADNLPKIYLKNDLPATWLFTNATTDADGLAALTVDAPELANSTWVMSGFALDQLHGMGISEQPQQLEIYQPYFVKVDLPRFVKRGETVAIQMVVYNYLSKDLDVRLTLENPGGKSFTFGSKNPNEVEEDSAAEFELHRTKQVGVKPGRGTLVSFLITPQEIGQIEMKISAETASDGDFFLKKQTLSVETEGERMRNNTAILLDLRDVREKEFNITLEVPRTAVKGSEKVYVSAAIDPLGPAMNNLGNLLTYPLSSAEPNMLRIVPGVIVRDYLESIGQLQGDIEVTSRTLMEDGYQRQLAYKLKDGSFSQFGESDKKGSVWVTALVARYLRQAKKHIDVDESVILKAMDWLVAMQSGDGSFPETGLIFNSRVQENTAALTAFTTLAFLDNRFDLEAKHTNAMNKAISYLAETWKDIEGPYAVALVTYVLHLADHPQKNQAHALLESFAQRAESEYKYWETELEDFEDSNPWTERPNSANIEITSYALLTYLLRNEFDESMPVARWLLKQQNENGGFASSTDTMVAILALKEFSAQANIPARGSDISIQYTYLSTVRRMQVKSEEPTIFQRRILPSGARDIGIRATGGGFAVVQVGYEYNLNVTAAWPSFVVSPQVFRPSTANHMQVTVCANYIEGGAATGSNMAVMEVNLPSGFTANKDNLPALRRYKGVRRVDAAEGDTRVVLYFGSMGRSEVCPTISAFRTHRVANQKPASVLVYDFYDQSRHSRSFYDIVPATLCDICQGDDCPSDGCPERLTFPTFGSYAFGENIDTLGGASAVSSSAVCVVLAAAALARLVAL